MHIGPPLPISLLALVCSASLLGWRLWVGLGPELRWKAIAGFASTAIAAIAPRVSFGTATLPEMLLDVAAVYLGILVATLGRPERAIAFWKLTDEPEPSPEIRRSVRRYQTAMVLLVLVAAVVVNAGTLTASPS